MTTYVTTVAQYLEGQWRDAGYEFESTGFRQGAIQRMLSQGLIDLSSGGGGGGGIEALTDIPNLVGWWDPDDAATVTLDGSDRVEQVNDKSASSANATQGTSGSRPHTATLNGRTWLDFSQGSHWLTTVGPPVLRTVRTYFAVLYLPYATHTGARRSAFEAYPQWYQGGLEVNASNNLASTAFDGNVKAATDGTGTFPLQQVVVAMVTLSHGGGLHLWRGNAGRGAVNLGEIVISSYTGFRLGTYRDTNDRWYNGYLGDLLMIEGQLSAVEQRQVYDILTAKWAA